MAGSCPPAMCTHTHPEVAGTGNRLRASGMDTHQKVPGMGTHQGVAGTCSPPGVAGSPAGSPVGVDIRSCLEVAGTPQGALGARSLPRAPVVPPAEGATQDPKVLGTWFHLGHHDRRSRSDRRFTSCSADRGRRPRGFPSGLHGAPAPGRTGPTLVVWPGLPPHGRGDPVDCGGPECPPGWGDASLRLTTWSSRETTAGPRPVVDAQGNPPGDQERLNPAPTTVQGKPS